MIYQLATYTQTEAYFKNWLRHLTALNWFRWVLQKGVRSTVLIVTSPENLKKLDRYKEISQKLAHAEDLTDGKAFCTGCREQNRSMDRWWLACQWRAVGAHQLIQIAYNLTSRKDAGNHAYGPNTTIILLVHANPTDRNWFSNWYMRESKPEKRSLNQLPRLYRKICNFDNNRDFYMLNLEGNAEYGSPVI